MLHSGRIWRIVGALVATAIVVLLAAIAGQHGARTAGVELAPGESIARRARVLEVMEERSVEQAGFLQPYQRLRLEITGGPLDGQEFEVEHGLLGLTNQARTFRTGDRVLVEHTRTLDGLDLFVITDYVRTWPLAWLTLLFVAATLLLSGWQGLRSLVGMAISLVVITTFVVPQILKGQNPLAMAIAGSVIMMGISLYLVYGWRNKTHVAVAGLLCSLIVTGLLAIWFVGYARLTGFGSEEVGFLQVAGVQLNLQGLLLAGILIGTLGALDDIAIGQSSAIFELSAANPTLGPRALFRHGMNIGRDHIAAMVNTLLLAYVGAALPLVLLFSVAADPISMTLNREIVAEEIVRTLVGSLGLLSSVPLTSAIAAFTAGQRRSGRGAVSAVDPGPVPGQ